MNVIIFVLLFSDTPFVVIVNLFAYQKGEEVISYADKDDVPLWSRLQNSGNIISKRSDDTRVTDQVVKEVHRQLSLVYNIKTIPYPVDGMMFVWNRYPYNGGWVEWMPGSKRYDIKRYLTRPFGKNNIFINHGYWGADYNGWGESSLEAADDVLSFFNVPSYLSTVSK